MPPNIYVRFNGASAGNTANFSGANGNCVQLSGAQWKEFSTNGVNGVPTNGTVYVNDHPGQSVRLMGGTSIFQPGSRYIWGKWTP